MLWIICLVLAVVCIGAFCASIFAGSKKKCKKNQNIYGKMFTAVLLSASILFFPICVNTFKDSNCGIIEVVFITLHSVIKLFVVDGDFDFVTSNLAAGSYFVERCYIVFSAILFVIAPILTFSLILSFFRNLFAHIKYCRHFFNNVYVFSELNEKSLTLARNIRKNKKNVLLVFCGVLDDEGHISNEYIESAKNEGAVCFKKELIDLNLDFHSKGSQYVFFAIGNDESVNIDIALRMIEKYKYKKNSNLYVFSTDSISETLIATAFKDDDKKHCIKIRRVNETRSLIDGVLYRDGYENVFCSAVPIDDDNKLIHILVLGMGRLGTEMTKGMSWFCQMDGYLPEIDCFDMDKNAEGRFSALCPELMSPEINGRFDIEGESKNRITVHSGMDVTTKHFEDTITGMSPPTYIFVSLGNDELNIHTAIKMREVFLRKGCKPVIQAVVSNADKNLALKGITNFKKQRYDIDFVGNIEDLYSEECIFKSDIEQVALERHLKWGCEDDFWKYDYNYKSSIASAIHQKMKRLCEIPGIDKPPGEREDKELWGLRILEHCRWNAFMRSEGYVYGGTIEKSGRNDLAKMHNCLVPFEDLPLSEKIKDDD